MTRPDSERPAFPFDPAWGERRGGDEAPVWHAERREDWPRVAELASRPGWGQGSTSSKTGSSDGSSPPVPGGDFEDDWPGVEEWIAGFADCSSGHRRSTPAPLTPRTSPGGDTFGEELTDAAGRGAVSAGRRRAHPRVAVREHRSEYEAILVFLASFPQSQRDAVRRNLYIDADGFVCTRHGRLTVVDTASAPAPAADLARGPAPHPVSATGLVPGERGLDPVWGGFDLSVFDDFEVPCSDVDDF